MDDVHIDVTHLKQAKEYYSRALASCLRKLWVEHVDGGTCYGNLGVVHCLLAAVNEAKGCHDGTPVNVVCETSGFRLFIWQVFPGHTWVLFVHSDQADLKASQRGYDVNLLERLLPDYVDVAPSLIKTNGGFGLLW